MVDLTELEQNLIDETRKALSEFTKSTILQARHYKIYSELVSISNQIFSKTYNARLFDRISKALLKVKNINLNELAL